MIPNKYETDAARVKRYAEKVCALEAKIAIWEQCWDNIKMHQPGLREDNKPLAVAASYESLRLKLEHTVDEYDDRIRALEADLESSDGAIPELAKANERISALKAALTTIVEVSSGAEQVADDDTGGMAWIDKFARRALVLQTETKGDQG